jgi:hypothetical protein
MCSLVSLLRRESSQVVEASGLASHVYFIVRNDARASDIVVQMSDTTAQAYNRYGGSF